MPTNASPARAANETTEFLPADPDTLPCLQVAGALVFAYVTDEGVLEVSAHLDTGDIPGWLLQPDDTVPVHVTINGDTVAALPTSLTHQCDQRDATLDGDPATAVTAGALAVDLSRHDPRCPVWVQDTLLPTPDRPAASRHRDQPHRCGPRAAAGGGVGGRRGPSMTLHVVQYSGGIGSWATARRVAARHGTRRLVLLFADTLIEADDVYSFLHQSAA